MPLYGLTVECMSAFRFWALCTDRELAEEEAKEHFARVHVIDENAENAQGGVGYVVEQGYIPMLMTVHKVKAEDELARLKADESDESGLYSMRTVKLDTNQAGGLVTAEAAKTKREYAARAAASAAACKVAMCLHDPRSCIAHRVCLNGTCGVCNPSHKQAL